MPQGVDKGPSRGVSHVVGGTPGSAASPFASGAAYRKIHRPRAGLPGIWPDRPPSWAPPR